MLYLDELKREGFPSERLLYSQEGIQKIDEAFVAYVEMTSLVLAQYVRQMRQQGDDYPDDVLMELACLLETFLEELFDISVPCGDLQEKIHNLDSCVQARRSFVQRFVLRSSDLEDIKKNVHASQGETLEKSLMIYLGMDCFDQLVFSHKVLEWLTDKTFYARELAAAKAYTLWRLFTQEGSRNNRDHLVFQVPFPKDYDQLLKNIKKDPTGETDISKTPPLSLGFSYRGEGGSLDYSVGQMRYCLFCHPQKKDSCSHGLKEADHSFQKNPLGRFLEGCPLRQKISQMNQVAARGYLIGALGIITLDNPLALITGAHICNECKEACLFQKQDGVDVPRIETQILRQVLALPFGFEIYSLLTRWRPLAGRQIIPDIENGRKVLVAGMGPAGCMMAHLLINRGYTVVGIDGLTASPLPQSLIGINGQGFTLIKECDCVLNPRHEREGRGFGGVLDYGITARWDKSFLTLLRVLLERRGAAFTFLSGVRFGGALDEKRCQQLGFDHIALCMGAGSPKKSGLPNDLMKGVWLASDFLMSLHNTVGRDDSLLVSPLIRLPCLVLGGGLTAVDAATEVIQGYVAQVITFTRRYEALCATKGEDKVRFSWREGDREDADVFLAHGRILLEEIRMAASQERAPDFISYIKEWGGVTILYRKPLRESPAYKINVEELQKALESGVSFLERSEIIALHEGKEGALAGVRVRFSDALKKGSFSEADRDAKMLIVAYGTLPNVTIMREGESIFVPSDREVLASKSHFLLPSKLSGLDVSVLGDLHPHYAGSVVRALASAKEALPFVEKSMMERSPHSSLSAEAFSQQLKALFQVTVKEVNRLAKGVIELIVEAPWAAETFHPGQFFRLCLLRESMDSLKERGFMGQDMEGVALTGCQVDLDAGTLSLVVLENGASTSLIRYLNPGEHVSLMGPTGTPTPILKNQNVVLVGGGLGTAVIFSLAQAMKKTGCRVVVIAGYRSPEVCFKKGLMESVSDEIFWCFESKGEDFDLRKDDHFIPGTVVDGLGALWDHFSTQAPSEDFLKNLGAFMVVGSASMMEATQTYFTKNLTKMVPKGCMSLASINAPMNCMLKEVCGKCIQRHVDPYTKMESFIFSCTRQDQSLETTDFKFLKKRLDQNRLLENMSFQWLDFLTSEVSVDRFSTEENQET